MASKFNMRNPAVKRIMQVGPQEAEVLLFYLSHTPAPTMPLVPQEMRELQQNPSEDIMAEALEVRTLCSNVRVAICWCHPPRLVSKPSISLPGQYI